VKGTRGLRRSGTFQGWSRENAYDPCGSCGGIGNSQKNRGVNVKEILIPKAGAIWAKEIMKSLDYNP